MLLPASPADEPSFPEEVTPVEGEATELHKTRYVEWRRWTEAFYYLSISNVIYN